MQNSRESKIITILLVAIIVLSVTCFSLVGVNSRLKAINSDLKSTNRTAILQIYNEETGEYDTYTGTINQEDGLYGDYHFGRNNIQGVYENIHYIGSIPAEE